MVLRGEDKSRKGLVGVNVRKKLSPCCGSAKNVVQRRVLRCLGHIVGLHDVPPGRHGRRREAAKRRSTTTTCAAAKAHMEVGKLILNVAKNKATMTLSVKPFGCMPSAGVSDGVQSIITEKYPAGDLLPDRDQRRRRGERLLARADDAVQGAPGGQGRVQGSARRRRASRVEELRAYLKKQALARLVAVLPAPRHVGRRWPRTWCSTSPRT